MPQSMHSGSQSREELPNSAHAQVLMSMSGASGSVAAVRPDQPDQCEALASQQQQGLYSGSGCGSGSPGNDQMSCTTSASASASTPTSLSTSSCLGDIDPDLDADNDAHLCAHAADHDNAAPCDYCHSASPAPDPASASAASPPGVPDDTTGGCQAMPCGSGSGEQVGAERQGQLAHQGQSQGEGRGQGEGQLGQGGQGHGRQGGQGHGRQGQGHQRQRQTLRRQGGQGQDQEQAVQAEGEFQAQGRAQASRASVSTLYSNNNANANAGEHDPRPSNSHGADWNGLWSPVGNVNDHDHMMHLMSTAASSGSGSRSRFTAGSGGIQDYDAIAAMSSRAMAHANSNSDQGSFLARQHHHSSSTFMEPVHMDLRPMFPSASFYMNHGSGSEGSAMISSAPGHSLQLPRAGTRVSPTHTGTSTGTASTACSKQDVDFCESLLNVDLNSQHHMSGGPASCSVDLRTSGAGVGSDGDTDHVMMDQLQEQAGHGHHNVNSWMQMEQWMDSGSGHTTQLSSSLVHHRDSPSVVAVHESGSGAAVDVDSGSAHLQWSSVNCNPGSSSLISGSNYGNGYCVTPLSTSYAYGSNPQMSLPPGSDYIQALGCASPASAYLHFNGRHHLFGPGLGPGPTRSLSSPNLAANVNPGEMGHAQVQHPRPPQVHGLRPQAHATSSLSQLAFMHTSPPPPGSMGSPHLPRSLSTSALHSDSERLPDTSATAFDMSNSGVDHDDCGPGALFTKTGSSSAMLSHSGLGGGMAHIVSGSRRHSPSVKRSLSFMQQAGSEAEDAACCHSPGPGPKLPRLAIGTSSSPPVALPDPDAEAASRTPPAAASTGTGAPATATSNVKTTGFRPGIDDAAAQLSALLYTKSQTDIGNNAIAQYHKLAFQNSFYNSSSSNKADNPSASSTSLGVGAKHAARRRHGTATDPQSIAARTRRERFSDRIRILQSLVPNGERLDTVSMLGQTLEYVRFLQQQVWQLYNGTSTSLPGSATGSNVTAATNLAAQVASAESLAASFLSSMAQRQAAAANAGAASASPGLAHSDAAKLAAGGLDKWKLASGSASHLQAECTQVA